MWGNTEVGTNILEIQEIDYKTIVCDQTPFQSSFWAAVKKPSGWKPMAFSVTYPADDSHEAWSTHMLVLIRTFSPGMSLAYVPFGPDVFSIPMSCNDFLKELSKDLRKRLPHGVFAIRYDLPWDEAEDPNVLKVEGRRFKSCAESVQPEGTVRIDLTGGYAAVARGYRERARRNIRKSSPHTKVEVWNGSRSDFDAWYDVYLETARRDGFTVRPGNYLRRLLAFSGKLAGDVRCTLYLARHKGRIVAGCINLESAPCAVYLFGASLRLEDSTPSYVLQDTAIRGACDSGCAVYDLHGIPGPDGRGAHLRGLELFKKSFGGSIYYRTPSTDYVYRPIAWRMFSYGERMRYRLHRHPVSQSLQSSGSNES